MQATPDEVEAAIKSAAEGVGEQQIIELKDGEAFLAAATGKGLLKG